MRALRLIFLLGIASFFLTGREAVAAVHLTLKDVVRNVVLHNPEVLAKWHAFNAAAGEVDVARGGFYPRVDITGGVGKDFLKEPGLAERVFTRRDYAVTLNQMLYDGFATSSDVQRLGKARLTRYFELLDAAENTALETGRAYYDVMRYRYLMYLAENNYVEHRVAYEQLLRRAQAGAGRRVDVEHAASRLALAELNLNTEAANLHDVTARYLRLVGEKPPPVMFQSARSADDFPASETEALKMAFRRNPALRASLENVETAHYDLERQRSAFHPKLDLRLRNDNVDNYLGSGTRQNSVAEVVLSYNLFNGGADVARQSVYAERKNQALDLRDKSCRDIRQTISIAYHDVIRLRAQLSSLDVQVSSIERTRDAYKAQFNIGQRSLLDLLDTENELLNARRTATNTEMDLAIAYLRTQAGIGRLLEFLQARPRGIDDSIDPQSAQETEICPPDTPNSILVDIEELTARAIAMLDASRSSAETAIPRSAPAQNSPASAPLSSPPPMPVSGTPGVLAAPSAPPLRLPATTGAGSTAVATATSAASASEAAPALLAQPQEKNPTERVKAWAAAWSAKAYDTYAGFYASSFVPADGASRDSWAKQRARRLAKPGAIQVEVSKLKLNEVAKDVMVTEFKQSYHSEDYSGTTQKALRWIRVGGQWLIDRETVLPVPSAVSMPRKARQ